MQSNQGMQDQQGCPHCRPESEAEPENHGLPGQFVPRHEAGGQARMELVRFPSAALLAVAPSSH